MSKPGIRYFTVVTLAAAAVVVFFSWLTVTDREALVYWCDEDFVVENLTAIFFALSAVGFIVVMKRSRFLKGRGSVWAYSLTFAWVLLMIVFTGEEISWGQRIFGFETPDWISATNKQNEFNFHNIATVDSFLGGKFRYLSIMMLATGLLFPLMMLTRPGKRLFQAVAFPVAPLAYWLFFVGAYAYCKFLFVIAGNDSAEVRELIMSMGMLGFAWHGAFRPDDLFRVSAGGEAARPTPVPAVPIA